MELQVKEETGFSAVEMLLCIIIALLIGFIGYYIYHAQKTTTATINSTSKIAQDTAPKATKKAATKTTTNTTSSANYVTIKEWGVRAVYSGNLSLYYSTASVKGEAYAIFGSKQLDAIDPACLSNSDTGGYGGDIDRYAATDEYLIGDGDQDSGQTAQQYAATLGTGQYGHVGNYYYFYTHPQGLCAANSEDVQTQTEQAVQALIPTLESIPS